MKAIWKFPLAVTDAQEVRMPTDSDILCVQIQHGQPCLWAIVNTDNAAETRTIKFFGTGHDLGPAPFHHMLDYIGTIQMADGALVWRVFESTRLS